MSEHSAGHLSPAQIMQTAEGRPSAETVAPHLEHCAECRAGVVAWRVMMAELAPIRGGGADNTMGDCPPLEDLAGYAARTGEAASGDVMDHLARCSRCSAIVDSAMDTREAALPALRTSTKAWRREMSARYATKLHRWPSYSWFAVAAALVIVAGGAIWWNIFRHSTPEVLLARAYTEARPFDFRLQDDGYGPVRQRRGAASAFDRPEALIEAERAIQRRLASRPGDPVALALKGRAELIEGNYEQAIEWLQRAQDLEPDNADVLADLGCAYAFRGDVEQSARNYPLAIDLLLKSIKKRPNDSRTLFNLALRYERMSMVDEAIDAWKKMLGSSRQNGWTEEARRHLKQLETTRQRKRALDHAIEDPAKFLAALKDGAEFAPELYQDVFWGEWLPASNANMFARAAAAVEAREFKRRFGDRSLEQANTEAADVRLQVAFKDIAHAIGSNIAGDSDSAREAAERAITRIRTVFAGRAGQTASMLRAQVELIYARRKMGSNGECLQLAEQVIRSAEKASLPWLAGQAHLEHASCADGVAHAGAVRAELVKAQTASQSAGLKILALRASGFLTGADRLNSNFGPIWGTAATGMAVYWHSGAFPSRAQEFLFNMQAAAEQLGWKESAEVFFRAAIRFVEQSGNRSMEADDRVYFASFLGEKGDHAEEVRELDRADSLIRLMPAGPTRDYILWDSGIKRAEAVIAAGRAQDATRQLEQLSPGTASRGSDEQMQFHQTLGMGLAASGNLKRAVMELQASISLNQAKLASLRSYLDKLSYLQSAAKSYRCLTQIQLLDERSPERAFRTWKIFKNVGEPEVHASRVGFGNQERLGITYALVPAGIVVFTQRGGAVRARLIGGPEGELENTARVFLRLCASPSSSLSEIRRLGHKLFRGLIAPELLNGDVVNVDIRADSWLGAIPFGALTDNAGNWFGRTHSVLILAGPGNPEPFPKDLQNNRLAAIVAAPVTAAPDGQRLPALSSAEAEAEDVAGHFRNVEILRGSDASVENIAALASRSTVFHFAGHGWSNGENGALMLPPTARGESQFITARELARQNWRQCSLAVLSACLTATGEQQGSVNSESLVQALLSAGTRNVVAARWSVDSEATRVLMSRFYARISAGHDPSAALAGASSETASLKEWSHPYYWAGFDVFGKDR